MHERHGHGELIGGGIIAVLFAVSSTFRWLVGISVIIVIAYLAWGRAHQEELDPSLYNWESISVQLDQWSDHSSTPLYHFKGKFRNLSDHQVEEGIFATDLYNCPSEESPLTDCEKVAHTADNQSMSVLPNGVYYYDLDETYDGVNTEEMPHLRPIARWKHVRVSTSPYTNNDE